MKTKIWTDASLPGKKKKKIYRRIGMHIEHEGKIIQFSIKEYQGFVKNTKLGLNSDLSEAFAILKAINWCNENSIYDVCIYTDSRTIHDALHNKCKLRSPKHIRTRRIVQLIKEKISNQQILWIKRRYNKAHKLT